MTVINPTDNYLKRNLGKMTIFSCFWRKEKERRKREKQEKREERKESREGKKEKTERE